MERDHRFYVGLARATGGAVIFALPMLMTMELWWLGLYMSPVRLALFLGLTAILLVALSRFAGFENTFHWIQDVVDAAVALCIAFVACAALLALFGLLTWDLSPREAVGRVAVQAVPASIGALLAQSQFGGETRRKRLRRQSYAGAIFLMAVGALFLSLNVAPTEEMMLIAFKMTPRHAVCAAVVTLLAMHAFVYSVEFHGQAEALPGARLWSVFLRYTIVGYAICLLMSAYVLWTFGRLAGMSLELAIQSTVVLAFPAGIGASAARLLL